MSCFSKGPTLGLGGMEGGRVAWGCLRIMGTFWKKMLPAFFFLNILSFIHFMSFCLCTSLPLYLTHQTLQPSHEPTDFLEAWRLVSAEGAPPPCGLCQLLNLASHSLSHACPSRQNGRPVLPSTPLSSNYLHKGHLQIQSPLGLGLLLTGLGKQNSM